MAEEKRAVFRALTRLRGAAIASFDGIARSQTGNIDQYAKVTISCLSMTLMPGTSQGIVRPRGRSSNRP